ncbi:MAG: MFS transporter, partial [Acidobacteria bacterium]|nr:MFS transporter [Acidobacteriota bacterium]
DRQAIGLGALARFFRRPGAGAWTAVVVLLRSGEAMATYVFNQMLVDLGLDVGTIGWISGGVYAVGALLGALAGGILVELLPRRTALVSFTALQALALLAYALVQNAPLTALATVVFLVAFTGGMATTALYTTMMDASLPPTAATDFTLQQSLCALGPVLGIAFSGFSASFLGFSGHYVLCAGFGVATVLLILRAEIPGTPAAALAQSAEA